MIVEEQEPVFSTQSSPVSVYVPESPRVKTYVQPHSRGAKVWSQCLAFLGTA